MVDANAPTLSLCGADAKPQPRREASPSMEDDVEGLR